MGIRFLANRAEIFYGNSGNYYLSIAGMKSMLWRLVSDFDFWGPFLAGKCAWLAPKGLGPINPTKKLAHVGFLFSHMLSQNHAHEICDPGPPFFFFWTPLNVNRFYL